MKIGLLCAMPEEIGVFTGDRGTDAPLGDGFYQLEIGGIEVVACLSGLGKVHAAAMAVRLVERFGCAGLISAGTAGGLGASRPMQVVIADSIVQHDYGRSLGAGAMELYRPGLPPLPEYAHIDEALVPQAEWLQLTAATTAGIDFVSFGRYASGDTFVNDLETRARLESLNASAVDMESGAIAQIADSMGIPWLVAKGISDDASSVSHQDFLAGLDQASRHSAEVVTLLVPELAETLRAKTQQS